MGQSEQIFEQRVLGKIVTWEDEFVQTMFVLVLVEKQMNKIKDENHWDKKKLVCLDFYKFSLMINALPHTFPFAVAVDIF